MSDLADREADSTAAVAGAGGTFDNRNRHAGGCVTPRSRTLQDCTCGGRPVYAPHPALSRNGPSLEVLKCGTCGNAVGPYTSRQMLATSWRLGGFRAEHAVHPVPPVILSKQGVRT
jgi:hypothetical protein